MENNGITTQFNPNFLEWKEKSIKDIVSIKVDHCMQSCLLDFVDGSYIIIKPILNLQKSKISCELDILFKNGEEKKLAENFKNLIKNKMIVS